MAQGNALGGKIQIACKIVQNIHILTEHIGQAADNSLLRLLAHLPDVRRLGVFAARPGVCYIEQIAHAFASVRRSLYHADTLCAAIDTPVLPLIPERQIGAGCCIRALIVDQHLRLEVVLIHSCRSVQKALPAFRVTAEIPQCLLILGVQIGRCEPPSACYCLGCIGHKSSPFLLNEKMCSIGTHQI